MALSGFSARGRRRRMASPPSSTGLRANGAGARAARRRSPGCRTSHECTPWERRARAHGVRRGGPSTGAVATAAALAAGCSQASISVESRAMCPMIWSPNWARISAAWTRAGNSQAVNSANAREKREASGIARNRSKPQIRRSDRSAWRRSINASVVGRSNTALATKARARATRSCGGRPTHPRLDGIKRLICVNSSTRITFPAPGSTPGDPLSAEWGTARAAGGSRIATNGIYR
jgi:hypothetical protein